MGGIFSQRGGLRYDYFYATWPFAKITADAESITIRLLLKDYILKKHEIAGLLKYTGSIHEGLLIRHKKNNYPNPMLFSSSDIESLMKAIEALGYTIGKPLKSCSWHENGP